MYDLWGILRTISGKDRYDKVLFCQTKLKILLFIPREVGKNTYIIQMAFSKNNSPIFKDK